ncbi:hypothetical protein [Chitinimonas koreensis]|uniref:hypothetical protein n=1 Tax=Chitinimonas koreensis TaxID=356302 RepID=UPI0012FA7199|nr:hypothetical protein [Chitinimonas koreensis]QNM95831.1 hypothetical protein H9L41_18660 [Chitinimonas koreensis]
MIAALVLGLTGCDRISELANQAKLNGRAIGAACRHSGRALEDCFQRNPRVSKADVFAGWKEMNEYMAKNKLEVVAPPADRPAREAPASSVEIGGGTENQGDAATPPAAEPTPEKTS